VSANSTICAQGDHNEAARRQIRKELLEKTRGLDEWIVGFMDRWSVGFVPNHPAIQ
jgi:hypothetical protein